MSNLINKLSQDLISFQKAKDEVATSTLRLLLSDIHNAKIAKGEELSSDEVLEVINKSVKRRKESIEAYKKGNREDLVKKEEAELKVLEKYQPEQMNEEELGKIVDEVVKETGASGQADMGKVMGQVMSKVKGRARGEVVSKIVKQALGN